VELASRPVQCVDYTNVLWDEIPKGEHGRPLPGAMFWIHFSSGQCDNHEPPCEKHLMVVCPDGHMWNIDSRCSNCGSPEDKLHHCWVRHGDVPNITVDKNGVTCSAGGGSIQTPDWHGFLRNGQLVD
jgi:hypothetical protein